MANTTRSRYQDLWEELKKKKELHLAARQEAHPRLTEAVKKRKKLDIAYAFKLSESAPPKKAKLEFVSQKNLLIVRLNESVIPTWI